MELSRLYQAVKDGIGAEYLAEPINELNARKVKLIDRLDQIQKERDEAMTFKVTDADVNDVLEMVQYLA